MGIEVAHSPKGIFLSQRKYALDILKDCGHLGARQASIPMEQNLRLTNDQGALFKDPTVYRWLVGRLIYLTITRPDIVYLVNILSQFMHQPRQPHYDVAVRVLRYLKSSPGKGIILSSSSSLRLSTYFD